MQKKSIVVLANSFKLGGRCVAGKVVEQEIDGKWKLSNEWLRPVSSNSRSHGALPNGLCRNLREHRPYQPLDIVEMGLTSPSPEDGQPENWRLADLRAWTYHGSFDASVLPRLVDDPRDIWIDANSSINFVGSAARAKGLVRSSLLLIEPQNLSFRLSNDYNPYKEKHRKKTEARFVFKGVRYSGIDVTDPYACSILQAKYPNHDESAVEVELPNGSKYALCVSLAPPFDKAGYAQYKLVAAVIPK